MYLEFHLLNGEKGEVHLAPYSYTFTGDDWRIEDYLDSEPIEFYEVENAPVESGDPSMNQITDERRILEWIGSRLSNRGISVYEIVE